MLKSVERNERIQEKPHGLTNRTEEKKMQNDYSCPLSPSKSDQIDLKLEDIIDAEDENGDRPSIVIEEELRNLMTQGEMEILTTLFPKASKTLAGVLRRRPR